MMSAAVAGPRREQNRGSIPAELFRPIRSYTNPMDVTSRRE
jgi:hypothetical protein